MDVVGKLLLFSLLLCACEVVDLLGTNYCPEASPQCRCNLISSKSSSPRPYSVICESGDKFPNLTDIGILPNTSTITFNDFNVTANSNFSRLRDFPNFIEVRFRNLANLSRVDWNWFSDRAEKVRVTSVYDVTFGTEEGCDIRSGIIIDTVQLIMKTLSRFPTCLPPRTRLIGVSSTTLYDPRNEDEHFLADFYTGEDSCYDWPNQTSTIRLQHFDFDRILPSMFCDPTYKINVLHLGWCRYGLHSLSNLPRTLTKLSLYDCKLEDQTLDLSDAIVSLFLIRVCLVRIPVGLPASLEKLDFDGNNITKVDGELEHLSNLKMLSLQSNQLTEWPDRLPRSLVDIYLLHNFLEYIPSNAFVDFKNLSYLILENNRLLSYPLNLPMTIVNVDLGNNLIRTITGNYRYCNQCKVDIRNNPLLCNEDLYEYIRWMAEHARELMINGWCRPFLGSLTSSEQREELFHFIDYYTEELGCEYNVDSLICTNRSLTSAPLPSPFSFQSHLDLGHNQITQLPDSIYLNQTYVQKIALDNNLLREIPNGLPYEFLTHLWLRRNRITHVTRRNGDEFVRMNNLQVLDLGENLIKMVSPYDFRGLTKVSLLRVDSNPFDCVCAIFFFAMWIETNLSEAQQQSAAPFYFPSCATPKQLEHRPIVAVLRSFSYICMDGSCYYEHLTGVFCSPTPNSWWPYSKTEVVGMIGKDGVFSAPTVNGSLTMTNANWTDSDFANITNLPFFNIDLSNNLLTEFPTKIFGEFTTVVDLSGNMITYLPYSNNLVNLTRLQSINFTNNQISIIHPKSVQTLHMVPVVSLEGNPLSCECEQLPLMTWLESVRDRLRDDDVIEMSYGSGIHAMTCVEPEMLRGRKMLDEANENFDQYCPIPVKNRTKLIIVITIPALIIVILASILLNIYLDKKRKKRESENIILGFKQLLSKESEIDAVTANSYKYDAFISYANKEEDFVYSLIKELEEKRTRKISFHQRDFIAGLSIVDNIVECIGNSSRVILIISDDFIRSSWCQYEVQVALANMHKRRRGKLLVPVLVQGNKNEDMMRGNTKTILSEISAITAPDQHAIDDVTTWKTFCDQVDHCLPTTPSNVI